ncbi:hypothetical protein [Pimelobacter simplex]|uniref:hypothetical protein n=1 Tax=Nocardioides simplex TaxID=2045 RepID=UPI003AAD830C
MSAIQQTAAGRPPVAGVTITLTALVQAVSVVPALGRGPGGLLVPALVAGTAVVLSLAVTAAWVVADSVASFTGPRPALLAWSAGGVLLLSVLVTVFPLGALVVAVVLPPLLVAVAAGRPWRRPSPVWAAGTVLLTVVLAVAVWLVGVVLGLVDAGVAGAFAWWVLAGLAQIALLRRWAGHAVRGRG